MRRDTRMLVSFGDCAVTGNVTAMRNPLGTAEPVLRRSYLENGDLGAQIAVGARDRADPAGPGHAGARRGARGRLPAGLPAAGPTDPRAAGAGARRRADPAHGQRDQVWLNRRQVIPMTERIVIDPVTRIEGHAKITVYLDDDGQVSDAQFHVTEFRGFEKFCEGRPLFEMPGLTARVCGICPVSHLLASAKAGDPILAVTIPPAAAKLRRLMNLGADRPVACAQLLSPRARLICLLGFDSDPAKRNVFGLMQVEPELARGGIRLRQFGQEIIEILGGKKIHPAWAVPGGVAKCPDRRGRDHIRQRIPEALATAQDRPGSIQGLARSIPRGGGELRQFPDPVHGHGRRRRLLGTLRRPNPLHRLRRGDRRRRPRPAATTRISSPRRSSRLHS